MSLVCESPGGNQVDGLLPVVHGSIAILSHCRNAPLHICPLPHCSITPLPHYPIDQLPIGTIRMDSQGFGKDLLGFALSQERLQAQAKETIYGSKNLFQRAILYRHEKILLSQERLQSHAQKHIICIYIYIDICICIYIYTYIENGWAFNDFSGSINSFGLSEAMKQWGNGAMGQLGNKAMEQQENGAMG